MIKRYDDVECRTNRNVRGGAGEVVCRYYLNANSTRCRFDAMNLNEMEPGATIAEHRHEGEEEYYFIVEGRGIGVLNGEQFQVGPGDSFLCRSGETHGIYNTVSPGQKLKFISVFFKQ